MKKANACFHFKIVYIFAPKNVLIHLKVCCFIVGHIYVVLSSTLKSEAHTWMPGGPGGPGGPGQHVGGVGLCSSSELHSFGWTTVSVYKISPRNVQFVTIEYCGHGDKLMYFLTPWSTWNLNQVLDQLSWIRTHQRTLLPQRRGWREERGRRRTQ